MSTRNVLVWLPMLIALLICAAAALRAQPAPPPSPGSDAVTFTEDSTRCKWSIYGSDRGLEVVRSRSDCVVHISVAGEPA